MQRLWRTWVAVMRAALGTSLVYRAEVIIWMLSGLLPLVMLAVWLRLAEAGAVGGYSRGDFVAYYFATLFVRQLVSVWIIWDLEREIRLGAISSRLLKPLNPIVPFFAMSIASKPLRVAILLPVIVLALLAYPDAHLDLRPLSLLAFGAAVIGGLAIYFLTQYCIGLLAFWISQAVALHTAWFNVWLIFSGYLIPLDLLPPFVARIGDWLPFGYTVFFPVQLLMGRLAPPAILRGLAMQALWVALLLLLWRLLWYRGLRAYAAVGA